MILLADMIHEEEHTMVKTEKVDWVTMSFDGGPNQVAEVEDLFRGIGCDLKMRGGNKCYRFGSCSEGVALFWQNRMKANRFFQVELSGLFFKTKEREEWACDFISIFKGKPSRIDVAWDFYTEGLLDVQEIEGLKMIEPKWPMKRKDWRVNGVYTGFSYGMGKGSEVSLRAYNKGVEQAGKAEAAGIGEGTEWWRVEIQVNGNTLKDQGIDWGNCHPDLMYQLGRGFYLSRFSNEVGISGDREIQPRKRGGGGIAAKVLYWERIRRAAQGRLDELNTERKQNES